MGKKALGKAGDKFAVAMLVALELCIRVGTIAINMD